MLVAVWKPTSSNSVRRSAISIYLYIKQQPQTRLKYFGKTVKDPYTYNGSGVYWTRHCKKHGKPITLEVFEFQTQEECTTFALEFSMKHNIVESEEWANMVPEDGKQGGQNIGVTYSEAVRKKMSIAQLMSKKHTTRGKKRNEFANKISGKNNPMYGTVSPFRGKKHKRTICPHCSKEGPRPQMLQWHFDKCKKFSN